MEQQDFGLKKLFLYAVVYPLALIAMCCLAEWIENLYKLTF